jgi:hypothetical protein
MLSRALSLAAVTLLVGFLMVPSAWAQVQNLEAGKSPSQLFAGTCNACHRSPRGLLKTVSAGSLQGFLRQHYTTSSDMAAQLSTFLISNGAGDARYQAKQGADAKPASGPGDRQGRKSRSAGSQEAARPEVEPSGQSGRNARRQGHPGETLDSAKPSADGRGPAQAATERGPDGRKLSAKQRLSKHGKPGAEEAPATRDEPPKLEPAMDDGPKSETAKEGDGKAEEPKLSVEGKSEAARVDTPKDGNSGETSMRADPVPPVTAAPPVASSPPPAAASSGANEPAAAQPQAPAPSEKPAAVTVSEPSPAPPPVAAAGPPAPPISQ